MIYRCIAYLCIYLSIYHHIFIYYPSIQSIYIYIYYISFSISLLHLSITDIYGWSIYLSIYLSISLSLSIYLSYIFIYNNINYIKRNPFKIILQDINNFIYKTVGTDQYYLKHTHTLYMFYYICVLYIYYIYIYIYYIYIYIHMYVCVCVLWCVCVCVYIYNYIFIYIYTHIKHILFLSILTFDQRLELEDTCLASSLCPPIAGGTLSADSCSTHNPLSLSLAQCHDCWMIRDVTELLHYFNFIKRYNTFRVHFITFLLSF